LNRIDTTALGAEQPRVSISVDRVPAAVLSQLRLLGHLARRRKNA